MPIVDMEMQFVKIQQILDNLTDHPMLRDIPIDRAINYIQELIRIVGAPKMFFEKTAVIEIKNYRGELPCDFARMLQVRGHGCEHREYVATMDNFHTSEEHKHKYIGVATYKIQGDVIITSTEDKPIEIAYLCMPIDENGWPMLPDNAAFIRAVESYIKVKRFTILFDQGQINQQVYANAQQDYAFNIAQAQNSLIMPTVDEMETITNMWNTLIPRVHEHRNGFATAHNAEYIRRH